VDDKGRVIQLHPRIEPASAVARDQAAAAAYEPTMNAAPANQFVAPTTASAPSPLYYAPVTPNGQPVPMLTVPVRAPSSQLKYDYPTGAAAGAATPLCATVPVPTVLNMPALAAAAVLQSDLPAPVAIKKAEAAVDAAEPKIEEKKAEAKALSQEAASLEAVKENVIAKGDVVDALKIEAKQDIVQAEASLAKEQAAQLKASQFVAEEEIAKAQMDVASQLKDSAETRTELKQADALEAKAENKLEAAAELKQEATQEANIDKEKAEQKLADANEAKETLQQVVAQQDQAPAVGDDQQDAIEDAGAEVVQDLQDAQTFVKKLVTLRRSVRRL